MSPALATSPSPSQMSLISRSAGGSPPGKSISGFSMLTELLLQMMNWTTGTVLHLCQQVHGEHQGGLGGDGLLRLVTERLVRRDDQQDTAADLLADQTVLQALEGDLGQREGLGLALGVGAVERLSVLPQQAH